MSPISAYGPSVYQYLQNVGSSQQAGKSGSASKAKGASQTQALRDSDGDTDGSSSSVLSGYQPYNNGVGSLFKLIQAAVSSSLQSAQSSGAASSPNQVIQSAISQVLKGQQGGGGSDPDGDGDTDTPGVADTDASANQSAFTQLLQSNGVNAQQFQQDFFSAIQSAQGGGAADAGSVFGAFPPGSLVDTLA